MTALKTLIFTIVVPGTVAGIIPWLLVQGSTGAVLEVPSVWMLGFVPLVLGVGLYLWCAGAFTFIGKGTPAPIDAPTVLVVQGPYRWVRNPMYIAVLAVVLGEAILFRSFLLVGYALLVWAIFRSFLLVGYALLVWTIVHTFVVTLEEPSLRRQFGASYETYLRTVSRWVPHPPRT